MEASFECRVVRESEDVEGRTSTYIQVPHRERGREARGVMRQFIDELEVQRNEREVVSDADLDIRPKSQMLDQLGGFEMHAGVKLIRVDARAHTSTHSLRSSGGGEQRQRHHR